MANRTPEQSLEVLRAIRAKMEIALEVSQCLHIDRQLEQIERIKRLERETAELVARIDHAADRWLKIDAQVDDTLMNEYRTHHLNKGAKHGKAA